MPAYEVILISLSVGQLLAMIIGGYIFLQKPSLAAKNKAEEAADELENQKTACQYKHKRIDEIFEEIRKSIAETNIVFGDFRKNDFKHIEDNSKDINVSMAKLDGKMDIIIGLMKDVLNK